MVMPRRRLAWPLAGAIYLLLSLAFAAVVYLGTRHHPIAHQRFATVVLPGAFVVTGFLLLAFLVNRRLSAMPVWLALDLLAWLPLLVLTLGARSGRANVALWVGVAITLKAAALLIALGRAVAESRIGDRTAAWLLVAISILFYVAPLPVVRLDRGLQLKGDEPHYMVSTISLLRDGDLFVENEYAARVYAPFYDAIMQPPYHTVAARDGHLASFHDLGLPILAVPAYAIGGWIAVLLAMAAVAGLTVREMFLGARALGADPVAALTAASLVGFSLPFAVFATQVYPEIPGAFLTAFAARQLLAAPAGRRAAALITGVALGILPWLQVRFWAIVLPLLIAAVITWRGRIQRLLAIGPVVAFTLGYIGLNAAVYGRLTISPFLFHESIGPQLGTLIAAAGGPLGVVLALLRPWLDPYDGPFWIAPITILAVAAIPLAVKRSGLALRAALVAVALYGLFIGLHYLVSTSGDSPPGRFLTAIVPLLALPLAVILDRPFRRLTFPLAMLLAAGSAVMVVISLAEPLLARYPFGGLGGPVASLGRRFHVPIDDILPSFPQPSGAALFKSALAAAAIAGLALLLVRILRPKAAFSYSEHPYNGSNADLSG